MEPEIKPYSGGCHCGAVRFQVRLTDGFQTLRRCSCSYCRMRGAIAVSARLEDIDISQSHDSLTLYQFNTGAAKHYLQGLWHLHTSSAPLAAHTDRHQRRLSGWDKPL